MNEVLNKLHIHVDSFGQLKNFNPEGREYAKKESQLKETWSSFSERLQQRIGEQDTDEKLSVFIKITQDRLTDFADKVFEYYKEVESSTTECQVKQKLLFNDIENEIVKVLEFLKLNFSNCFNYFGKVPRWIFYINKDVVTKKNSIISGLEKKSVNEDLIVIISSFLDKFQDSGTLNFKNWHQYIYYKKMVRALCKFVESPDTDDDTMNLIKRLIGYNFNLVTFYYFMVDYIEKMVVKNAPFEEPEITLLQILKNVGNIRPELSNGYNPEVQPILESVNGSILHQLSVIAKLKQVDIPDITGGTRQKKAWHYFEVSSTLEELLFFFKVMQAISFIKTRYNSNLYRFVERHIKTDRTRNPNPSPQYMRNIFAPSWEFSPKVVRKVRSWLTRMIAYIDAHFPDQLRILLIILILRVPADLFYSAA
ncbi:hypothetical protein [Pedobacter alluvionis]|uniref:Uncharacterized protein n=1 Tax=Pedobacter alluvionis TaxID=475253 RepID=A0A497Y6F2_9SPHI|nr:hypothetical protein [Pedobacter alluvionis]RLJ77365.1 hypothetical protein BCL90_2450 [Pedobacter alluvionis]TFB33416.1 hypothetical protein E3V97_05050 [Pedobacter alluvionis]